MATLCKTWAEGLVSVDAPFRQLEWCQEDRRAPQISTLDETFHPANFSIPARLDCRDVWTVYLQYWPLSCHSNKYIWTSGLPRILSLRWPRNLKSEIPWELDLPSSYLVLVTCCGPSSFKDSWFSCLGKMISVGEEQKEGTSLCWGHLQGSGASWPVHMSHAMQSLWAAKLG